ncbi:MAG: Crp/Fnr family transcriptional regulator [Bacteroidota bacterium]|nr:Crp/Fnr family transcriptional regulator [Bacteroidota bacterium]
MEKTEELKIKSRENTSHPCFDEHIIDDIINICESKKIKFYKKNHVLYCQNTKPEEIFYLIEGKVKILITDDNNNERIIKFATAGDFLGVKSAVVGNNYVTSAVVIENSTFCVIAKDDFTKILKNHSDICYEFIKNISNLSSETYNGIMSINGKPEKERLAHSLLLLNSKFKSNKIEILKKDLANYSQVKKKKLKSYLNEFKSKKLIHLNSARIRICDINGLKEMAKMTASN